MRDKNLTIVYTVMLFTVSLIVGVVGLYFVLKKYMGRDLANGIMVSVLMMFCILPPMIRIMIDKHVCHNS